MPSAINSEEIPPAFAHHLEKASLNGADSHKFCSRLVRNTRTGEEGREVPEDLLSLAWPAELSTAREAVASHGRIFQLWIVQVLCFSLFHLWTLTVHQVN